MGRSLVHGLTLATATLLSVPGNAGRGNPNPGIVPPSASPHGHTYGEWGAMFWQWALGFPTETSPLIDGGCGQSPVPSVWFHSAPTVSGERECTLPSGKSVFLPIWNWIFGASVFDCEPSVPGVACDIEALYDAAAYNTMVAEGAGGLLEVTIDGQPVLDEAAYRAAAPEPFEIEYPDDSLVGLPAGTYYPHVSDGYWLMIGPLKKGVHEVRTHVIAPGTIYGDYEFDNITYFIVE